jgi:hypothetical protein
MMRSYNKPKPNKTYVISNDKDYMYIARNGRRFTYKPYTLSIFDEAMAGAFTSTETSAEELAQETGDGIKTSWVMAVRLCIQKVKAIRKNLLL